MKDSLVNIKDRENKIRTGNCPLVFGQGWLIGRAVSMFSYSSRFWKINWFQKWIIGKKLEAHNIDTFFKKFCWKIRDKVEVRIPLSFNLTFREKYLNMLILQKLNCSVEGVVEEL